MDTLQFILAFAPIISRAAMQTYYSALPLMPSESLLSKKYSAMSRPSLKLSESSYSWIINHPQVTLPGCLYSSANSDGIIALLHRGEITFFDTRTGNKISSQIPTQGYLIAFSPDGKCIAIQGDHTLKILDVKTCTCIKTVETKFGVASVFEHITYSADGEKVMVVTKPHLGIFHHRFVFILDVKTDKPLIYVQLEVDAFHVAISPDGSQIAINDMEGIKIIDVCTGHIGQQIKLSNGSSTSPVVWSPNGQFLASASTHYKKTEIHLLPLTCGSGPVCSLTIQESSARYMFDIACSPDSSKVVAVNWDYEEKKTTLHICSTWSLAVALIGTTSFGLASGDSKALSFAADSQDIIICAYNSFTLQDSILYHISIVPAHLETYMNHPPKFHPSQVPHTIQYSCHISGAIEDYASYIDVDGWILNTKRGREIWTPWANYELLCSCKPPQEGQTQYRTLEVKDPETKTVVLIYVIAFEQKDVNDGIQGAVASVK